RCLERPVPSLVERTQVVEVLADRQSARQFLVFRDVTDVGQLFWREGSRVHAQNRGISSPRLQQIHEDLDRGGLAGPIRADQRKRAALGNAKLEPPQGIEPAVSLPQIVDV